MTGGSPARRSSGHAMTIDIETLELDKTLSIENQIRAQLAAAIADNQALKLFVRQWRTKARKWERCAIEYRDQLARLTNQEEN